MCKGHSRLLLGSGPLDPKTEDDLLVDLGVRDAIVLPAGVAHCSIYQLHIERYPVCEMLETCPVGDNADANACRRRKQR